MAAGGERNGARTALPWMLTISSALVVLVVTAGITYARWVDVKHDRHADLEGHPTMVERVDGLGKDVTEIKGDVKELLRRTP